MDEKKQTFAWNSGPLSSDDEEFLKLAEALMESSSIEEFKIYKDLNADIDYDVDEDTEDKQDSIDSLV